MGNAGKTTIRYVITHIGAHDMRTLTLPQQGRHTWSTQAEAETAMALYNTGGMLVSALSDRQPPGISRGQALRTLEVRPCECWEGHHDPVGIYFDDAYPAIVTERYGVIWDARGAQASIKPTGTETVVIMMRLDLPTTPGSWSFMDAFMAMWREADPVGHAARFGGTFYASEASMQADDEEVKS